MQHLYPLLAIVFGFVIGRVFEYFSLIRLGPEEYLRTSKVQILIFIFMSLLFTYIYGEARGMICYFIGVMIFMITRTIPAAILILRETDGKTI